MDAPLRPDGAAGASVSRWPDQWCVLDAPAARREDRGKNILEIRWIYWVFRIHFVGLPRYLRFDLPHGSCHG